jgi:hypothetical protein
MPALKRLVSALHHEFLEQFSGFVIATPFAACKSKLLRSFKADIVAMDEFGRFSELDFLQVIR